MALCGVSTTASAASAHGTRPGQPDMCPASTRAARWRATSHRSVGVVLLPALLLALANLSARPRGCRSFVGRLSRYTCSAAGPSRFFARGAAPSCGACAPTAGHSLRPRTVRGRGARPLRRASAEDDEVAQLLAQAAALRNEAAQEKERLEAARKAREAEDARKKEEIERLAASDKKSQIVVADAKLSIAEGRLRRLEASGGDAAALEAQRRDVEEARRRVAELRGGVAQGVVGVAPTVTPAQSPAPAPASAPPTSPAPAAANKRPMTEGEWVDLAKRYENMNFFEQFSLSGELGPQGRRKLMAIVRGDTSGTYIVPGARVTLLQDETKFREAFSRFQRGDALNGYSDEKLKRMGQQCVVEVTFRDKTLTCLFDDGVKLDFPWEAVANYSE